jgi:hypothetical protein
MRLSIRTKYKLATGGGPGRGYKRHVEVNFTEDKNNLVGTADKLFVSNNHQGDIANKSITESKIINKDGSTYCV